MNLTVPLLLTFIIQENIHEIELSNINDFAIAQSGINITNLTDNQRRIVRALVGRNIDREKIKYIIVKWLQNTLSMLLILMI